MGDGGAKKARRRARRDAARYERQLRAQEAANQKRLAEIQAQNQQQQAAIEATMQANVRELTREPTTIKRRKRPKRGSGGVGRDSLRIAMQQMGSSTNLGSNP
jgi:hypothetical protein